MKQKIYIIGIILFILTIFGTLFKIMHYPGAGILMTLGFLGLIIIFFPIGLIHAFRSEKNKSLKPLYIVTYLTMFILFTSMLFKIMHWPLAGLLLLIALPFPFLVFLPVFLIVTKRIENFSIYKTVSVLLLLTFMSAFNALLALNVSKVKLGDSMFLASMYHRTATLKDKQIINNKAENEDIIISSEKVLKLLREAKKKFIIETLSDSETLSSDPYNMKYVDSRSLSTKIMFINKPCCLGHRLEQSIKEFIDTIALTGNDRMTPAIAAELLEFTTIDGENRSWSERMFIGDWASWSLVYLGMLENNVMLIRSEMLADMCQ
ncbi:MAG: hypothetical protein K8R35_09625 [Bacteroidales bacterium]|nr:hypothetical protein [Bacteroidales bacterium]